ncbi:type II toxin-antitoxin system Phd/YefM family antitoxin [Candidatus Peregrinibacteria bacterium]|nr:type II toxin-antitoxin system Phd/YefM family antitoxin [Candidatus Peregrinibacteria bacterium]
MFKSMPKTASSREIQKNYRALFDEVMETKEPLFVLNNNKPEVVVISLQTYESLSNYREEYEQNIAQKAIESYASEKGAGKLKKLSSLADFA